METKTCSEVFVSLSIPILARSARRSFPAVMTLGDCVKELAGLATSDPNGRSVGWASTKSHGWILSAQAVLKRAEHQHAQTPTILE